MENITLIQVRKTQLVKLLYEIQTDKTCCSSETNGRSYCEISHCYDELMPDKLEKTSKILNNLLRPENTICQLLYQCGNQNPIPY